MTEAFRNVYEDATRAAAYARLAFPGTYALAFRDLPGLLARQVHGHRALDFGCGAGRSTRFLRDLGFDVVGVDISRAMLAEARAADPAGRYVWVAANDPPAGGPAGFDVVLAAFTFDNIPTDEEKLRALRSLHGVLAPSGTIVLLVSRPEIYNHEWVSFSTRDFPENRSARHGDTVRIVMLDVPDRRPVVDVLATDEGYRRLFAAAGLAVTEMITPLGIAGDGMQWVSEAVVAPWAIYVLRSGANEANRRTEG